MTSPNSEWTVGTLKEFIDAQHVADEKLRLEVDRRYTSDAELRAIALKIKETADEKALTLAKEGQLYKDRQTDQLRDDTLGKSGIYATNASVASALKELEDTFFKALKPLTDFVSGQKGANALNVKQLAWAGVFVTAGAAITKLFGF